MSSVPAGIVRIPVHSEAISSPGGVNPAHGGSTLTIMRIVRVVPANAASSRGSEDRLTWGLRAVRLLAVIEIPVSSPVNPPSHSMEPLQLAAVVILALVALQLAQYVYATTQRFRRDAACDRMSRVLLDEQIATASELRIQREQDHLCWNGTRKFAVSRKVTEADGVCSFYLAPHDGKPLPLFRPGQFLTFRISIAGEEQRRCYSLSSAPDSSSYRITIKRVPAPGNQPELPAGVVSNHFHDQVHEGDLLDVEAPRGSFTLERKDRQPLVFLAGGVGVTPFISMVAAMAAAGSTREVWLFYGIRNRSDLAFEAELDALIERHPYLRRVVCYSDVAEEELADSENEHASFISVDLLKRYLESNNCKFLLCGPPPMMTSLIDALHEWGVPKDQVQTESFGSASAKALTETTPGESTDASSPVEGTPVTFSRTGKSSVWDNTVTSLLELAERTGVEISSGCRTGSCGSCRVAIKSGNVRYNVEADADHEERSCLACITVPDGELVLDA
mgnify:CR=1 FL=1